jgi:hypothetical protein
MPVQDRRAQHQPFFGEHPTWWPATTRRTFDAERAEFQRSKRTGGVRHAEFGCPELGCLAGLAIAALNGSSALSVASERRS